jgi:hypothetical protein
VKIYLSSTFEDLREYRRVVYDTLERAGHEVAWMEHYVASDERPVDKCLDDVVNAEVYVGIFAWRYGYVPPVGHHNPQGLSITELEFNRARAEPAVSVLPFVLDEREDWPDEYRDEVTGANGAGLQIQRLRDFILQENITRPFSTRYHLAVEVLAAVSALERNRVAFRNNRLIRGGVSPLSSDEVFERSFGLLSQARRASKRRHFESLKSLFVLDNRPLMGSEQRTANTVIEEQFAVYFEGRRHFLKLQTYPLPRDAREVRAVAVSDDQAADFIRDNPVRVILERAGQFRLLRHRCDAGGLYWPLAPVFESSRLFIVAGYIGAQPLANDGIVDIWIEVGDLAGEFRRIAVAFGGVQRPGTLRDCYQLQAVFPPRFHPVDTGSGALDDSLERAREQFARPLSFLHESGSLDRDRGEILRELWGELCSPEASLDAVQVERVVADLLLIVESDTGAGREALDPVDSPSHTSRTG